MDWYINDEDGITNANGETYPGLGKSKEEKAQVKHSNPLQRRDREERTREDSRCEDWIFLSEEQERYGGGKIKQAFTIRLVFPCVASMKSELFYLQ